MLSAHTVRHDEMIDTFAMDTKQSHKIKNVLVFVCHVSVVLCYSDCAPMHTWHLLIIAHKFLSFREIYMKSCPNMSRLCVT